MSSKIDGNVEQMDVDAEPATIDKNKPKTPNTGMPNVQQQSVMASSGTVPSVTVSLHPLVIMNISEHWTRIRAQAGEPKQGTPCIHTYIPISLIIN